jgi:hypothetical protein
VREALPAILVISGLLGLVFPLATFGDAPQHSTFLALGPRLTVVQGTQQISPPAIQFAPSGALHAAWFEKKDDTSAVRAVRIADHESAISTAVQVNPAGSEPNALHQAPGLTAGANGELFVTWSTPQKQPGTSFAADLLLARSENQGATFEPPVLVNDDGKPINHTFEHVSTGPDGVVYLAWLDGRGQDRSGAAAIFACSRDTGRGIDTNLTIDGMACPCCRPMASVAPDGAVWVAWRKTFEGNVRDIVLARSNDQGRTFSPPTVVHEDGWAFPACPHRGPALAFDRFGRLYVGWYTEGTDEQPRLLFATSDDQGKTFTPPFSLHTSTTSLPDQLRMAVHPNGIVTAVWEEVTGVRKRVVMRVSLDRGRTFGPVQTLSEGAKAEYPAVAIHENGAVAVSWTEHAWPNNRLVLQQARFDPARIEPPQ